MGRDARSRRYWRRPAHRLRSGPPLPGAVPLPRHVGDGGGWFVNWWNAGTGGKPSWETIEVDQVITWIDENFPTIPDRDHRAIADPVLNVVHWKGHDPDTLLTNLTGMDIAMWVATGLPGTRDITAHEFSVSDNLIEGATALSTHAFDAHLSQAKIPHHLKDYVFGTLSFPYWAQDLRKYVSRLMDRFAHRSRSTVISFRSIDKSFSQRGWNVDVTSTKAEAMTEFDGATVSGFQVRGTRATTVTTPALYQPIARTTVKLVSAGVASTKSLTTDADGRIAVKISLGILGGPSAGVVSINP